MLTAELLAGGTIALSSDMETLMMPAVLLHDIAVGLLPDGAPLDEGALRIETGQTAMVIMIVSLGDVSLSASELGGFIQFTLVVPGFDPSSMSITVTKETLTWLLWIQVALLVASLIAALLFVAWFIRRGKKIQSAGSTPARGAFA
jgi:hypothetical protein